MCWALQWPHTLLPDAGSVSSSPRNHDKTHRGRKWGTLRATRGSSVEDTPRARSVPPTRAGPQTIVVWSACLTQPSTNTEGRGGR